MIGHDSKFQDSATHGFLLFNRNCHSQKWRHKNLTEHICLAVNAFAFFWHTLSSKNHPTLPIRFPFKDFKSPQCCSSIHADLWKGEHIKDIDALMCLHPHATKHPESLGCFSVSGFATTWYDWVLDTWIILDRRFGYVLINPIHYIRSYQCYPTLYYAIL